MEKNNKKINLFIAFKLHYYTNIANLGQNQKLLPEALLNQLSDSNLKWQEAKTASKTI
jgi:hypothetical protein